MSIQLRHVIKLVVCAKYIVKFIMISQQTSHAVNYAYNSKGNSNGFWIGSKWTLRNSYIQKKRGLDISPCSTISRRDRILNVSLSGKRRKKAEKNSIDKSVNCCRSLFCRQEKCVADIFIFN